MDFICSINSPIYRNSLILLYIEKVGGEYVAYTSMVEVDFLKVGDPGSNPVKKIFLSDFFWKK